MNSSPASQPAAQAVVVDEDTLTVDLSDGRTVSVSVAWFPRLFAGSTAERSNWRFVGGGEGIHWPDLDEDISVGSLLEGRRSGETQASLRQWLKDRKHAGRSVSSRLGSFRPTDQGRHR